MPFSAEQMEVVSGYDLQFPCYSSREVLLDWMAKLELLEAEVTYEEARTILGIRNRNHLTAKKVEAAHLQARIKIWQERARCNRLLAELHADRIGNPHGRFRLVHEILTGQIMYIDYIYTYKVDIARKVCLQRAKQDLPVAS